MTQIWLMVLPYGIYQRWVLALGAVAFYFFEFIYQEVSRQDAHETVHVLFGKPYSTLPITLGELLTLSPSHTHRLQPKI